MVAARDRRLARRDLAERPAEVHRPRARDLRRSPRDRAVEGPVELEDAGAGAEAGEPAPVDGRQAPPGEPQELPRRDVEQHRGAPDGQLVERGDGPAGLDRAAQLLEVRGERAGEPLRAAARDRPADGVPGEREHEAEAGAHRLLEREHRVRRAAGQQRPRPLVGEP